MICSQARKAQPNYTKAKILRSKDKKKKKKATMKLRDKNLRKQTSPFQTKYTLLILRLPYSKSCTFLKTSYTPMYKEILQRSSYSSVSSAPPASSLYFMCPRREGNRLPNTIP